MKGKSDKKIGAKISSLEGSLPCRCLYAKGICRGTHRPEARLREKYRSLREKAVNGVIPRKEVEKAFGGRQLKSIDQKEYILVNIPAVEQEEDREEDSVVDVNGLRVHI